MHVDPTTGGFFNLPFPYNKVKNFTLKAQDKCFTKSKYVCQVPSFIMH